MGGNVIDRFSYRTIDRCVKLTGKTASKEKGSVMRRSVLLCLAAVVYLAAVASAASSLPAMYQHNAIVVKLQPSTAVGRIPRPDGTIRTGIPALDLVNEQRHCVEFTRAFPEANRPPYGHDLVGLSDWYYLEFASDVDIAAVLEEYRAVAQVVDVQSIGIHEVDQDFPNDPGFSNQWALYQASTETHIHAPTGWEFETGDTIAVFGAMDTGVLWSHPDLKNTIWVNPGEDLDGDKVVWDTDDLNGIDDDGNGKIDDIIGWDFVAGGSGWPGEDFTTPDNDPKDFNGHGTHTAGIAAGIRNNQVGMAGIAGGNRRLGARIMPLRIGWSSNDGGVERGYVGMFYAAQAFVYAVEKGVHVINCSWGSSNSGGFGDAVQNALDNGVIITNSAGNDNDELQDYLATVPGVINVAATRKNDTKASYSTYGTWVTVSAPGGDNPYYVYATYSNHYTPTYASLAGTSMAAPMVAGLALLVKSHHPEYTRTEIYPLIVNNTDNIDGINPSYVGKLGTGRINVYNTLSGLTSADFACDTTWGYPPLAVTFTDVSTNVTGGQKYFFGDGDSAAGPGAVHTYTHAGMHDVSYRANGTSGWHTRRKYDHIFVLKDTLRFVSTEILKGSAGAGMPVYLINTLPVDTLFFTLIKQPWWPNGKLLYDSLTFGPRTSYFEKKEVLVNYDGGGQLAFRLIANNGGGAAPLAPGSGIVARVWFHAGTTAPFMYQEVCDSGQVGEYNLLQKTDFVDFRPKFKSGLLTVVGGLKGDANGDEEVNPLDMVIFVNFIYKSTGYLPLYNGDVNCDGMLNPLDVVRMVNFVYKGIPLPVCP